ncbi:Uncharacterised protein [Vibrio cholerae]|uniref:Uncharacterized protein n=1 Tax=Vibrio cholerae TaxID=666 RepID=A0A655U4Q6_VIBCL|nr:Uncharacterised protein [Vibrio cholerae]CSB43642.1 Uncharacterised protein [Vibrio cholerae]CSB77370.1 Uncharacterised protein [Vibrio cholerae]CSB93508.1 Uncharacterised protein [Vibrio cholerae]CSC01922.1 Uncharacterised protein [Vibrio cholerae]
MSDISTKIRIDSMRCAAPYAATAAVPWLESMIISSAPEIGFIAVESAAGVPIFKICCQSSRR